jgi:Cys-rich repeat protein
VNSICAAAPKNRAGVGEMCSADGDCIQGLICQNNKCDVTGQAMGQACKEDDDCGAGLSCQNGHCAPGMKADAGLPPGSCTENADCPSGQICQSGMCGSSGLPCDVQEVLVDKCQTCHGAPPIPTAPLSLVTFEDLKAADKTNPSISVAQACVNRMQDTMKPMPPGNAPTASAMEIGAFQDWIQAGMPMTTCNPSGPKPCMEANDCPGQMCINGFCTGGTPPDGGAPDGTATSCNDNGDCAGGVCVNGQCQPASSPDAGSPDAVATNPDAATACNDNTDCAPNGTCVAGQCVPNTPPDAGTPVDSGPPVDSGLTSGTGNVGDPCLGDSDCSTLLICSRRGSCEQGCVLRPTNCYNGYVCNTTTNHCEAPH